MGGSPRSVIRFLIVRLIDSISGFAFVVFCFLGTFRVQAFIEIQRYYPDRILMHCRDIKKET